MPWGERQDGGRLVAMGQAPVQVPLPQTAVPRVHARELMAGPERFLVELGNGASCDGRTRREPLSSCKIAPAPGPLCTPDRRSPGQEIMTTAKEPNASGKSVQQQEQRDVRIAVPGRGPQSLPCDVQQRGGQQQGREQRQSGTEVGDGTSKADTPVGGAGRGLSKLLQAQSGG
ncbi:hypothetical protein CB1_000880054 [Camelus ferus]|nr:hypothetical protein CB1_000880054 [Camelus ferus]